jgi:hypothetical protein
MKQPIIFFFFLAFSSFAVGQTNSLQEGNICFASGDYGCAIEKYKLALKSPDGRQKKIAADNLTQAEKCFELHRIADEAFISKNFIRAKEYYLSIINENPNDEKAKARLNEAKDALTTLSVSQNALFFSSSGGKQTIYVTTGAESYVLGILPSWCTAEKFEKYFSITCSKNASTTERTGNFTVVAGSKTESISIRQLGNNSITLSVSEENLSFSAPGGTYRISVNSNASSYEINLLPAWCFVQKYKGYFIVNCRSNPNSTTRTDFFAVTAGDKTTRINISQNGKEIIPIQIGGTKLKEAPKPNNLKPFRSLGFQSGEIAKYGLLFETGGGKTFGFHISARTSLTDGQAILNGETIPNKTQIEMGPNIKLAKFLYMNIGAGYGFYNANVSNDYAGTKSVEKFGYLVTTAGLMIRISNTININAGASFMDIDKDIYKPEIVFGLSFNLKK